MCRKTPPHQDREDSQVDKTVSTVLLRTAATVALIAGAAGIVNRYTHPESLPTEIREIQK